MFLTQLVQLLQPLWHDPTPHCQGALLLLCHSFDHGKADSQGAKLRENSSLCQGFWSAVLNWFLAGSDKG